MTRDNEYNQRALTSQELELVGLVYLSSINNPTNIEKDIVNGFAQYVVSLLEDFCRMLTPEELKLAGLDYLDAYNNPNPVNTCRLNFNYKNML